MFIYLFLLECLPMQWSDRFPESFFPLFFLSICIRAKYFWIALALRNRTYFKLKGNLSQRSHRKQVICWKVLAYISTCVPDGSILPLVIKKSYYLFSQKPGESLHWAVWRAKRRALYSINNLTDLPDIIVHYIQKPFCYHTLAGLHVLYVV